MAQLNNQLAETELIKKFRHDNSWLSAIPAKNNWVSNDVIKVPRRGAAPTVLINNAVYPVATNNRTDDFISLSLNKYDTENTAVTDDELYALAYEKLNDVQLQHRETLEDKTAAHALHALAVSVEGAATPVLVTTGANDGTGRKRLITADLITLWKKLGDMNVPLQGRIIVLSTEHAADLMAEDSARSRSWGADFQNGASGVNHAGFQLWVTTANPRYAKDAGNANKWTRQAFEAVTGQPGSVVIFTPNAVKATGSVKRYAVDAANNPTTRQNVIGFRLWFVAVGIKDEGFAAIVSGAV